MKELPIIGIIERKSLSDSNRLINITYEAIEESIIKSGGIPIGISNKCIDKYLSICDGFILQGGSDIEPLNIPIIKKINQLNIPLLGICLGMQEMALAYQGNEIDIPNHQNTYHEIYIDKNSLLYKITNKTNLTVNSRHKSAIENTSLKISAKSKDNTIEAIEDPNKLFFLGLQYHPENLYELESSSKKIFDYFINMCDYYKWNLKRR